MQYNIDQARARLVICEKWKRFRQEYQLLALELNSVVHALAYKHWFRAELRPLDLWLDCKDIKLFHFDYVIEKSDIPCEDRPRLRTIYDRLNLELESRRIRHISWIDRPLEARLTETPDYYCITIKKKGDWEHAKQTRDLRKVRH